VSRNGSEMMVDRFDDAGDVDASSPSLAQRSFTVKSGDLGFSLLRSCGSRGEADEQGCNYESADAPGVADSCPSPVSRTQSHGQLAQKTFRHCSMSGY
jgi:hypothetical protein